MVRLKADYPIKRHISLLVTTTVYCLVFHSGERTILADYFKFSLNFY